MQNGIQLLTQINRYLKSRLDMYVMQMAGGIIRVKTKSLWGGLAKKRGGETQDGIF